MDGAVAVSRHFGVVSDQDERRAGPSVDVSHHAHDLAGTGRIQVSGRFVPEYDLGVVDKGPGDGYSLLLTAGKLGWSVVLAVSKVDFGEDLPRRLPGFAIALSRDTGRQGPRSQWQ